MDGGGGRFGGHSTDRRAASERSSFEAKGDLRTNTKGMEFRWFSVVFMEYGSIRSQ